MEHGPLTIDCLASLPHYADHLRPVWEALPEHVKGTFWVRGQATPQPGDRALRRKQETGELVMVASAADRIYLDGRETILLEHGAGQTYTGIRSPSYSGGDGWERCCLFICPNERVAERWASSYPDAATAVVGCPRLDRWHAHTPPPNGTVALTFHWDNPICPESRWAFPHFKDGLAPFKASCEAFGYELVGHGHPRARGVLDRWWAKLGIRPVGWDDVTRADVLVGDNTSALPEFASLGRPVVWMNSPQWRRHVDHGGRFWDWPKGQPQADDPAELAGALRRAFYGEGDEARRRMVRSIYCATDGHAAERAAQAIVEVL